jgi:hypothetical protein
VSLDVARNHELSDRRIAAIPRLARLRAVGGRSIADAESRDDNPERKQFSPNGLKSMRLSGFVSVFLAQGQ